MSEVAAFDWRIQQQKIRDGEAHGLILIVRRNDGSVHQIKRLRSPGSSPRA
jgi:hypothetical protein